MHLLKKSIIQQVLIFDNTIQHVLSNYILNKWITINDKDPHPLDHWRIKS